MFAASCEPSALPAPDDRVDLVDEEDHVALGPRHLLEDGLHPFLELAAELGSGDERAHVQREDAAVLQRIGHVAGHDPAREALDDRGLADARLAHEDRVVLGAPGEDLHHAADLRVAADDGIELALARERGEVAAVLVEGLVLVLGALRRDRLVSPHALDRLLDPGRRDAGSLEPVGHLAPGATRRRQEDHLGGDVRVLALVPLPLRGVEERVQFA